jgi:hypothetical protein
MKSTKPSIDTSDPGTSSLRGIRQVLLAVRDQWGVFALIVMVILLLVGAAIRADGQAALPLVIAAIVALLVVAILVVVMVCRPGVLEKGVGTDCDSAANMARGIFVSAPMADLKPEEYEAWCSGLRPLLDELRSRFGAEDVYFAGSAIAQAQAFDLPQAGFQRATQQIRSRTWFLMVMPRLSASSALVEVGFALALGKRIIVVHEESIRMPYLLRGAHGHKATDCTLVPYKAQHDLDAGAVLAAVRLHGKDLFVG